MIVRRAGAGGLLDAAPVAAVDATGLEARHVSTYFRWRRGSDAGRRPGQRQRAWPKLTCAWHVASHLILGAVTGTGPAQDSPDFTPALRQARRLLRLDTVLADAAYDAEHHHALCYEALGVRAVVIPLNPRGAGRRWPKTPYRRAARRRAFPHALYAQRWHAESGFSRHKRRLGSALTARRPASQPRQAILRVLTHNLMLLARRAHKLSTEHAGVSASGNCLGRGRWKCQGPRVVPPSDASREPRAALPRHR